MAANLHPEHSEPTLGDAIVRARLGTMVVAAALEQLSALPEFAVISETTGATEPFAAERLATSLRRACQAAGLTDEATAAEAAYLAVTLLLERWPTTESDAVEKTVTLSELRCAAYDALMEQGNTAAARAYIAGATAPAITLPRRGPGLTLKPLPLAATGIGDTKSLERAINFAEKIIHLGTAHHLFADDASKSAFADAIAKLDAAGAWNWAGESGPQISFAPLSSVPTSTGQVIFGGQPTYYIPTCHLNFSTFTHPEGLRIEILLAAIEVALVAADILVEDQTNPSSTSATALRHLQISLSFTDQKNIPTSAIRTLVEGQLVAASARLARALGPFRAWPLNEKLALRQIGRLRDQAYQLAKTTPTELAERLRQVWDEALELAMAHGLRNAGLFPSIATHQTNLETSPPPTSTSPITPAPEPQSSAIHHTFTLNAVPAELWVSLKNNRPVGLSIRCGAPGSATTIILDTACAAITAALANGVDVGLAVSPLLGSSFPPRGTTDDPAIPNVTSPLDYACRWLITKFPEPQK